MKLNNCRLINKSLFQYSFFYGVICFVCLLPSNILAIPLKQLLDGESFLNDNILVIDWDLIDSYNVNIENIHIGDGYGSSYQIGTRPLARELLISGSGTKRLTFDFRVIGIGNNISEIAPRLAYRLYNLYGRSGYIRADFSIGTTKGDSDLGSSFHVFEYKQDYSSGSIQLNESLNEVWVRSSIVLTSSHYRNTLESGYLPSYGFGPAFHSHFTMIPQAEHPAVKLLDDINIVLEQGHQAEAFVRLLNIKTIEQSLNLEILNPHSEMEINMNSEVTVNLVPGEIVKVPLILNANQTESGLYDKALLKITAENGEVIYSPLICKIVRSTSLPDLSVRNKNINLSDFENQHPANISVAIKNMGSQNAFDIPIMVKHFNNTVCDTILESILIDETKIIDVNVPSMQSAGDHMIYVIVDSSNVIEEIDESNNQATRILTTEGQNSVPGNLLITAGLPTSTCRNALFNVTGRVAYDVYVDNERYTNYVVKGGSVQITVADQAGHEWKFGGIKTDVNGNFSKTIQAPPVGGRYSLHLQATDKSLLGSRTLSINVDECPAVPLPPSNPPYRHGQGEWEMDNLTGDWSWRWIVEPTVSYPEQDMRVYSDNVYFSKTSPDVHEEITVFAEFHYWSSSTGLDALNVPVNFYVTRPGAEKLLIGSAILDRISVGQPDYGSRLSSSNWSNHQKGIYIIEAEIDPTYNEKKKNNNAATRAIIVGSTKTMTGVVCGKVNGNTGGIPNVEVQLHDSYGMLSRMNTDENGLYIFDTIPASPRQEGTEYTVVCTETNGYMCDTPDTSVVVYDQEVTTLDFLMYTPEHSCIENLFARSKLNKVQLTWTDNGSSLYRIYRSVNEAAQEFVLIDSTTSSYSTYLDEGLTTGNSYRYYVTGTNSCQSDTVEVLVSDRRRR